MSSNITKTAPSQGEGQTAPQLFDDWFDPIETAVRERAWGFIEELIRSELDATLARPRYERGKKAGGEGTPGVTGHRHGSRTRSLTGSFGPIEIAVPRARLNTADGRTREWKSQALRAYQRRTLAADALIASCYLSGTNTRRVRRALGTLFAGHGRQGYGEPGVAQGEERLGRLECPLAGRLFFALQDVQGDEWLDNPTWNGQASLREHMVRRQLSASIIQAINRICCRHVTDEYGGCPQADVFIVLPSGDRGGDILGAIRREMPGLQVVDWPFEPDGPKVRRQNAGTPHERLLTFMDNRAPGRTSMQVVARELSLTRDAKKELQKNLRNENHPTMLALKARGVSHVVTGKGRGARSDLVKAA